MLVRREELDRTNAVTTKRYQQVKSIRAARAMPLSQSPADRIAIGKQIVEECTDHVAAIGLIAGCERHRQGKWAPLFIFDPLVEISEAVPFSCFFPVADRQAVHPDVESLRLRAARHDYQFSLFFFVVIATRGCFELDAFEVEPERLAVDGSFAFLTVGTGR